MKINEKNGSPHRFGYEWGKYSEMLPAYEEQFRRWLPLFNEGDFRNTTLLDVGCGMGRNSYWPLKYGAEKVISIDVDEHSINAAKCTLSGFENSTIRFMSVYEIDYEDYFDITFSIGVIHHLEHPLLALENMKKATKINGKVAIWVYGHEGNNRLLAILNPLRKYFTRHLPIRMLHMISNIPATIVFLTARSTLFSSSYFKLLKTMPYKQVLSIVFDQLLPNIANYWKEREVISLMEEAGLTEITTQRVNGNSWCAVGVKQKS
jgi:SAM-dependent methyltransferase